jgi:hypothetical protein
MALRGRKSSSDTGRSSLGQRRLYRRHEVGFQRWCDCDRSLRLTAGSAHQFVRGHRCSDHHGRQCWPRPRHDYERGEDGSYWKCGPELLVPDDIDRDLHRRNRSSVLKPVCGVPILGPAHSRPIVRSDSSSMVTIRIRSWRPAMPSISGPRSTVARNSTPTPFVSGGARSLLIVVSSLYFQGLTFDLQPGRADLRHPLILRSPPTPTPRPSAAPSKNPTGSSS